MFKDINIILISGLIFLLGACRKFVQIPPPNTVLVTNSVFADNDAAISAQLAIYAQMNIEPYNLKYYTGLSSDEMTPYSAGAAMDFYANTLTATNEGTIIWPTIYNYIYQENAIIEGVKNSTSINSNIKKQLIAEGAFNRAFWYFYLVNLFGDVPLITSTNYAANTNLPRADKAIVYQQIMADLIMAKDSLSSQFIDATDTVVTTERVRPTIWAAKALLARVYLYLNDWAAADSLSTSVISNSGIFQLSSLDSVFLKNSKETIWSLMPPSYQPYTYEGAYFKLSAPPGSSFGNITLDSQLLNVFEPGDFRKAKWIGRYINGTDTFYYSNKYLADFNSSGISPEYSMILRLAEQYFIRAEARVQEGNLNEAIADVNKIRIRAGLDPLPNSITSSQILRAIAQERRVELFTEADRWLDLKRTNNIDSVMTIVTPQKKGAVWQSYQQLYPISIVDLQRDLNLTQNQNY